MSEAVAPESKKLNLRCPYCGGKLYIMMGTGGSGYLTYPEPEGFECLNSACGAEWDTEGNVTSEALWVRYPDMYAKPEDKESNE